VSWGWPSVDGGAAGGTSGILAFQDRYNRAATPFDWAFNRTDLRALLNRIGPTRAEHHPHDRCLTPDELTNWIATSVLACSRLCQIQWERTICTAALRTHRNLSR
jgi:hypothetical protein